MTDDDRGLQAVARVRGVRERDSKLGLQMAAQIVRDRVRDLEGRREALDATPTFTAGSGSEFLRDRQALTAMAGAVSQAAGSVEAGRTVAAEALGRWQHDRSRLRAVELLGERRAQRRREEGQRTEAKVLDEVGGRVWLRGAEGRRQP